MSAAPADRRSSDAALFPPEELVPFPRVGRVYRQSHRVTHGAVTPRGRARLDAIAGWLQHLAFCDVVDAGVSGAAVWVARRTRIRIERFPAFGEALELRTACAAASRLAGEWRYEVTGDRGARIDAATLWVSFDPETWEPMPNPPVMFDVFGPSAGDRRARVRLTHREPGPDAAESRWHFRAADLDIAAHVNNAAYWQAIEEPLGDLSPDARAEAEIEHHAAASGGVATLRTEDDLTAFLDEDGRRCASVRLRVHGG